VSTKLGDDIGFFGAFVFALEKLKDG